MVRCRNSEKTLIIEIIPSLSSSNKPLLIFVDYYISGIVRLRLNLSAANPNLACHSFDNFADIHSMHIMIPIPF